MKYADSLEEVDVIPTGLFIDKLTGVSGIPCGAITEIFGDEGIGKSTLCLQIVANAQKIGTKVLWVDTEWCYDVRYASLLGVENSKVGIIRERDAESILSNVESQIEDGKWDLVIIDSIGGLTPRAEIEKGVEGKVIGAQAGLLARFCRKIVPLLVLKKVALVVINHQFTDIMSGKLMTSGGKKLAYHKSLSIRLKQKFGVVLKSGDKKVGKVVVGEVRKNKLAATEGLEVDGQLIFGTGFSVGADLLNDAIDKGVITKKGNTLFLGDTKLGVGLHAVRKLVESTPELQEKIKAAI